MTPAPPLGPLAVTEAGFAGKEARLAFSHWPAEGKPRAVLLALHGFGFYGGPAFLKAGPWWAARGIEVYAPDQRGFGRNPDRANWPGDEALIRDAAEAARAVKALHPDLPLFVLGHSMGGGIVLAAAGEGLLPDVAGIVALAPAVWGGEFLPLRYRMAAQVGAALFPERRWTGEGVVEIVPTDNLPLLREIWRDPLMIPRASSREYVGLIRLMDRVVADLPAVRQPVLVVMGAKDEVVPEAPVLAAFAALSGPKDYVRVEEGWHLLLHDLGAELVFGIVEDWMRRQAHDPA